jgi:hypothetical protein
VTGDGAEARASNAEKKANPKAGFLLCTAELLVARGEIDIRIFNSDVD